MFAAASAAADKEAVLVREYEHDNPSLIELSGDGRWLLGKVLHKDMHLALVVYDTRTGLVVGEHVAEGYESYWGAGFDHQAVVYEQSTEDGKQDQAMSVRWDPVSGAVVKEPAHVIPGLGPVCRTTPNEFVAIQGPAQLRELSPIPIRRNSC
jgi:hypothetical protein